ncbi:hypothetical protein GWI33_003758 [Rhynchophorus ferrugineus]|uniref:Uncharacterized protein n=1 Tax=Rhynchophorus ferrugineus TaxID=354439 RepID=A0A834HWC0_RHYFE|nr:hypothetical protein GWI33_003758 [Rhynchophorus ferrugineus]
MSQKIPCDTDFDELENASKRVTFYEETVEQDDASNTDDSEEEESEPEQLRVQVLRKVWSNNARSRLLAFIKFQRTLNVKHR